MFLFWTNLKTRTNNKGKKTPNPRKAISGLFCLLAPLGSAHLPATALPCQVGLPVCGSGEEEPLSVTRSAQLPAGPAPAEPARWAQRAPEGLSPAAGAAAAPAARPGTCARGTRRARSLVPRCPPALSCLIQKGDARLRKTRHDPSSGSCSMTWRV